jgi:hypothetical protein
MGAPASGSSSQSMSFREAPFARKKSFRTEPKGLRFNNPIGTGMSIVVAYNSVHDDVSLNRREQPRLRILPTDDRRSGVNSAMREHYK